jgi:hypothetical protein
MLELKHEKEKRKRLVAAARAARLLSDNMVWLIRSPEVNEDGVPTVFVCVNDCRSRDDQVSSDSGKKKNDTPTVTYRR